MTDKLIKLHGKHSIIGHAPAIVHAKADDLKTQPTGDARAAEVTGGVIGVAKARLISRSESERRRRKPAGSSRQA